MTIISASMRTDIPAFHCKKFINQLQAGYLEYINPYTRVKNKVDREDIDCVVFWSKNYEQLIPNLHILDGYGIKYYFQFTINGYPPNVERNVIDSDKAVIQAKELASKSTVIWRYDPIFEYHSPDYKHLLTYRWHINNFTNLAQALKGIVSECTISFLDTYPKVLKSFSGHNLIIDEQNNQDYIALVLRGIALDNNIRLSMCCEEELKAKKPDLNFIPQAHCIDADIIAKLLGNKIKTNKAPKRPGCGCAKAIDIGEYGTCKHECVYCYSR